MSAKILTGGAARSALPNSDARYRWHHDGYYTLSVALSTPDPKPDYRGRSAEPDQLATYSAAWRGLDPRICGLNRRRFLARWRSPLDEGWGQRH